MLRFNGPFLLITKFIFTRNPFTSFHIISTENRSQTLSKAKSNTESRRKRRNEYSCTWNEITSSFALLFHGIHFSENASNQFCTEWKRKTASKREILSKAQMKIPVELSLISLAGAYLSSERRLTFHSELKYKQNTLLVKCDNWITRTDGASFIIIFFIAVDFVNNCQARDFILHFHGNYFACTKWSVNDTSVWMKI